MSAARPSDSRRSAGARPPTSSSSLRPNTGRAWPLATSANTTFDTSTRELRYRPPSAEPAAPPPAPAAATKPPQQHPSQPQQHQQRESPARSIPASAAARRSANPNRNIPFHTRVPASASAFAGLVLPPAASRGSSLPASTSSRVAPESQQSAQVPPRAASLSASRSRQPSPAAQNPPARPYAGVQPALQVQPQPPLQQQQQQPSQSTARSGSSTRRSAGAQTSPASATPRISVSASPPASAHRHTPQRSPPRQARHSGVAAASLAAPSSNFVANGFGQRPPAPTPRPTSSNVDLANTQRLRSPVPYQPQAPYANAAPPQHQPHHVVYLESMAAIPPARPSPPRRSEEVDVEGQYVLESYHQRRATSPPTTISPAPWRPAEGPGGAAAAGSAPMRPSPPTMRATSAMAHGRPPSMPPPPPHQPSPPPPAPQQLQLTYYALAPSLQLTQHRHVRRIVAGEMNTGAAGTPHSPAWSQPPSAPQPVVFVPQGRAPPPPPLPHAQAPITNSATTARPAHPLYHTVNNSRNRGGSSGVAAPSAPADDTSSVVSDTSSTRSGRTRHVLRRGRVATTSAIPQGSPYAAAPVYAVRLPRHPAAGTAPPPRPPSRPAAASDAALRPPTYGAEVPPAPLFTSVSPTSPPLATLATDARWRPTPQQQQQQQQQPASATQHRPDAAPPPRLPPPPPPPQQQQQRLSSATVRPGPVSEPSRHRGYHPAVTPELTSAAANRRRGPANQPSITTTTCDSDSEGAASALPLAPQHSNATVAAQYSGTAFTSSLPAESSGDEPDVASGDAASPLNGPLPRFVPPRLMRQDGGPSAEHSTEVSGEPPQSLSVITVAANSRGSGSGSATGTAPMRLTTSPPWQSASLRTSAGNLAPPHEGEGEPEQTACATADASYGDAAPTSAASPLERPISSQSLNVPHSVHVAVALEAEALSHPSASEVILTRTARVEQRQNVGGHGLVASSPPPPSQLMPAVMQPIDPAAMQLEMPSTASDRAHMRHTMTPEKSGARRASRNGARPLTGSEEPRDIDVDVAPVTEDEPSGSLSDKDDRAAGHRYTARVPPPPQQQQRHHPQPQGDGAGLSPLEEYTRCSDDASGAHSTAGDDNTDTVHGAEQTQRPPGSPSVASGDPHPATLRESLERDLRMSDDGAAGGVSPLAVGERTGYVDPLEEASMDAAYMLDTLEQQYVRINEETREEMEDVVHVVELNRRNRAAGVPRTFVSKGLYSDVLPLLRYPVADEMTPETPATQLTYLPLSDAAYANLCAVVWLSRSNSADARELLARAQQHTGVADSTDDSQSAAASSVPTCYFDNPAAGLLTALDAQVVSHVRGFIEDAAGGAGEGSAAFTAACVALTDRDNIGCVRSDVWADAAARTLSLADHVTNVLLSATVPREAERRRALAARMASPVEVMARTTWTYFLGASPWNYEEVVEGDVHAAMPTAAARLAYAFMFKARMRNLDGGLGSLMFSMLSEQVPEVAFLDGLLMQEKLRVALRASAANVVSCIALRREAAEAGDGDPKPITQTPSADQHANGVHVHGSEAAPASSMTPTRRQATLAPVEPSGSDNVAAAAPRWTSPVLNAYLTFSEGAGGAASAASPARRHPSGSPDSLHLDGAAAARRPHSRPVDSATGSRASTSPVEADYLVAAGSPPATDAELARGDGVADLYSVAVQLNYFFPTKTERGMHQLCAALIEDLVTLEALQVPEEVHTPEGTVLTDRTSIVDALVAEGAQAMRHIIVSLSSNREAAVTAATVDAFRTPAGAIDTTALRSVMEGCLITFDAAVMYFLATPVPVDALFDYVVTDGPPSMQPQCTGRKSAFAEVLRLQHVAETVQYAMEMQDAILLAGQYNHLVAAHVRQDAQQQHNHHASDAVLLDHTTNTDDAALLAELDPERANQQQREHHTSMDKLSLLDPNTTPEGRDVSVRAVLMALCLADPAKPIAEVQEYLRHLLVLYFELHTEDGAPVDSGDAEQVALARLATAELTTTDWFGETTGTGTLVPGASPAACDRVRVDAEELASLCPRVLGRRVGLPSSTMADAAAAVISASAHGLGIDGDVGRDDDDDDSVRVAESASRLPYHA